MGPWPLPTPDPCSRTRRGRSCSSGSSPLPAETLALTSALSGRTVAADVRAAHDLPPFDNSAMDGYAVRAAEASGERPVAGGVVRGRRPRAPRAGHGDDDRDRGAAARGRRRRRAGGARARERRSRLVRGRRRAGDHVRRRGHRRRGELGRRLGGKPLAAARRSPRSRPAASPRCSCHRAPGSRSWSRATSSWLPANRCATVRSTSRTASSSPRAASRRARRWWRSSACADDAEATREALARALEQADVVVTSGGVSVGTRDHVKPALAALGVEQLFWRLAVQPGRPTWCGLRDDRVVVGLPGQSALGHGRARAAPAAGAVPPGGAVDAGPGDVPSCR